MAKVGLSFENPLYKDTGGVPSAVSNPFAIPNAGSASGSDALRDDLSTLAMMGARGVQLARENRFTMPEMRAPAAQPYYSPSRKEFFVQGVTFGADDAQSLLESEALLGGPPIAPPSGDWEPLDQGTYSQLVANVRRPSLGQLAAKSFGRGVDQLQMLAGRGLQLAGAEQLGGRIVEQQMEDLRKTAPYERQFTDIESGRDAVEWFVANLAQQGPNLLESVAVGLAGAAAGTAAAGPGLGTAAGTLAGFFGRKAFKDKVLDAATKYRAGQLTKDSAEYAVLKNASALTGALAASYASNLGTGAADIYGEMREQGVGPEDFGARMVALAGSLPYAGLESLSEYLLAGRILGGGGRAALPAGATRVQRGQELLRRGVVGGAVGGVAEGTTELGQEALVMGLSGQDLGSDEAINRFINAFAAGAAVGGPIGGIANLKSRRPDGTPAPEASAEVNLLDSTGTSLTVVPPAQPPGPGTAVAPYYTPVSSMGEMPQPTAPLAGASAAPPLLIGGPQPPVTPMGGPVMMVSPTGDVYTDMMLRQQGNIPPGAPGTQGVLDIFGGAISAQELANRMQPPVAAPVVEQPAAPAVVDPRQGVLQFAPPAPAPTTPGTVGLALEQVLRQRQMEAAYQQRAQQEAAQREAELARLGTVAQNQRLLDLAQPPMAAPMPMRPAGPVAPRQLELFRRREAPRPSRAAGLRRGVPGAALRTPPPPEGTPPKGTQLSLFTQEGQPTVAALKSAGRKEKVAPAAPKEKVPAARGQRGLKKQAGVAAVEVKEKPSAAQEGKLKQGRVGKRAEGDEGVRAGRPAGEQPKAQVPAGGAQAGGRGGALKRGEKQEEVRPSVAAALKKGQLVQAGQQWAQYADPKTQPKWADLTDAQKEAWRKVVIDDGRPSIAAAEEVAPPKAEAAKAAAPAPTETAEERWENMEGTPFADLPAELQTRWRDAVAKGTATGDLAAQLAADAEVEAAVAPPAEERELTPAEELADNISTAQEATDIVTFREAIAPVVNYAYFAGEDTNIKKLVDQARAFLANTSFTEEQKAAMDVAFLDELQTVVKLEARYKSTTKNHQKDDPKPWFAYAESRGLLPRITVQITNLPEKYKTSTSAGSGVVARTSVPPTSEQRVSLKPEAKLGNIIQDLVSRVLLLSSPNQPVKAEGGNLVPLRQLVRDLYAKVSEQGRNYIVRGSKLKDYFTADGEPKIVMSRGTPLLTTREITREEQAAINAEQRAEAKAIAEERLKQAREQVKADERLKQDWDAKDAKEGKFSRDDGTPLTSTVPIGRVRLLAKNFVAKLKTKPTLHVFANVEDLKRSNPALYRRAAAARPQGDFDTINAGGYSFGRDIIVFGDFIRTEQQLKFILAHEAIGHFGLRAVVPKGSLDTVLQSIYDADADLRAGVDAMVAAGGMPRLEAIEEYLADNAADIDNRLLARLWNTVKNFLNKLGFTFEDDAARYLINQARKYVRRGDQGNFINAAAIIGDLTALDQTAQEGRFARFSTGENGQLASRAYAAGALNRPYSAMGGLMGAAEAFGKRVFGRGKDVPETVAALLEQLQTLDNKARRSFGLSQVYRILERQQHYARSLLSKYQRMTSFTHSPDIGFFGKGVSEEDKVAAGELLARAALLRSASTTDAAIKKYGPLVKRDEAGNVTVDEDVRKQIERDGFVTAEEFRKGFDITYSDGGKVRFQYDVDENSPVWKVYLELRKTVNEAAIDMMLANYETSGAETRRVVSGLNTRRRGANIFTTEDLATIAEVAKRYQDLRYADSDIASAAVEVKNKARQDSEEFLVAFGRALFRDDVFAAWMKDANANPDIVKDMQKFLTAEYDDIRAQLPSLRAKIKNDKQSFEVQKAVRDLFMFDLQSKNADYYAKRTILGSYVPFTRRGTDQVRLVAVTEDGAPVALDENIRATLPYFQFDSRSEALEVAKELEAQFGGDNEWTLMDDTGNEIVVRLKPEVSKTRQSPDLTESMNFNEFVYVLNRLNISLNPQERERIVTTLTQQNARARRNLMRSGTEGWDKDVVRSVSEHLETSAHVSAKRLFRHRMDDIMFTTSNWEGDDKKLKALKAAVDTAPTEGERARAKRAYDEYAYMYRYMKAAGEGNTVEIDGKQVPTLGRGEDYKEDAKSLLRWYAETTNINDSTEDMLSGEAGSRLKMTAVLMQLGGSVATAALNLVSIITNSLPYLSFYNSSRGFGGGYGAAKSATALFNAARDLYSPKLADDTFLREMLEKGTYKQFNLTEDEAQFIVQQTEEGTLQAAQFNALVGTARGKVFNNKAQAAIKLWMSMFSYTEQANRRVTALAAYRMEKERLQAQGVTDEQELIAVATEAARRAVNTAQGEYAMYNRPEMARGNLLQYVFMYKQFVIITTQLLRGMPMQGRLMMLGLLLLMSGLKGIPFAEDLFDLIDTIAQKLGLKMASVEKELATFIDSIAPGMTPYVMRGVIDRATGATVSTRVGMGDMLPLTGIGRAGADPARELADFAGPVFGGISGLVGTAGALAKYGAEAIGLRDDTTSLTSILRDSPVATLRAVSDGLVYMSDGNITNARGQMVSNDAPALTIAARFLGFYPAIATAQNDIVRLSKYVADYSKAIKAEYVSAYVKARAGGDTERMQEILQYVRDWNEDARGTGLEITRFLQSANRAAIEAARPTALRYLKSAPKQMRPETIELLTVNGLMDEIR